MVALHDPKQRYVLGFNPVWTKSQDVLNEALFRMISYLDRQECHVAKKKNDALNDRCHDSSIYRYFFPFFFEN